jgi:hypothetical protein
VPLFCVYTVHREVDVASAISVGARVAKAAREAEADGANTAVAAWVAHHMTLAIVARFGRREHIPAAIRILASIEGLTGAVPAHAGGSPARDSRVAKSLIVHLVAHVRGGPEFHALTRAYKLIDEIDATERALPRPSQRRSNFHASGARRDQDDGDAAAADDADEGGNAPPSVLTGDLYTAMLTGITRTRKAPPVEMALGILRRMGQRPSTAPGTPSFNLFMEALTRPPPL